MQTLSQKIDQYLIDLAWSLWTELGVAGVKRHHQNCLIAPEELILLTAVVADLDPRLRDEALDWCSRHHHFISISRLRALIKAFGISLNEPFSLLAATLNSVSKANWPLFVKVKPLKFIPSGKSKPPRCESPALLYLRIRALFGVGARADLITFFLIQNRNDFTAYDVTEIGYGKRSLADLLDDFVQSGFFSVFLTKNQRNYSFVKRDEMTKVLGQLPKMVLSWRNILEVILPLRACIQYVEKKSAGTKITEIRSALTKIEDKLRKLNLTAPHFESDFLVYWESFSDWILKILESLAKGDFGQKQEVVQASWDEKREAAKRIEVQFKGLFLNIESLTTHSNEQTIQFLLENYKKAFQQHLNIYLPKIHTNDQKKIRKLADRILPKDRREFTESLKKEILSSTKEILEKYFN